MCGIQGDVVNQVFWKCAKSPFEVTICYSTPATILIDDDDTSIPSLAEISFGRPHTATALPLNPLEQDLELRTNHDSHPIQSTYPSKLRKPMAEAQTRTTHRTMDPVAAPPQPCGGRNAFIGLYNLLWGMGSSAPITSQERMAVPQTRPLPPFYHFGDTVSPPEGLIDALNEVVSQFEILSLPYDSPARFPDGPDGERGKLLVRPCYHRLLRKMKGSDKHAFILGQPETGKSTFLTYILVERLVRKEPTALQFSPDEVWTFTEKGVSNYQGDNLNLLRRGPHPDWLPEGSWFLAHSSAKYPDLSLTAKVVCRWVKVVCASTPGRHYTEWSELVDALELWVDIYSWVEVFAICWLLGLAFGPEVLARMAYSYLKYGSNVTCLVTSSSQTAVDGHEQKILDALPTLSKDFPRPYKLDWELYRSHHTITAIRTINQSRVYVLPASSYTLQLLSDRVALLGADILKEFYSAMLSVDSRMTASDYLLQIPVLHMLSLEGGSFRPRCLAGNVTKHAELNILPSEELIRFSSCFELNGLMVGQNRGRIWVPTYFVCSTVDAVVVTKDSSVWLIHVVTDLNQGIDTRALDELAKAWPEDGTGPWNLLLIFPKGAEISPRDIWGHSAESWNGGRILQFALGLKANGIDLEESTIAIKVRSLKLRI